MTAAIAEFRDVKVSYGGRLVLDVPHFSPDPGKTLTLIDPNGSGRITLLRVLALLDRPTDGQVLHMGKPVSNSRQALHFRRRVALVMQGPLLWNLCTRENAATGLRFRRASG